MKSKLHIRQTTWMLSFLMLGFVTMVKAQSPITFTKSFAPDSIGPGSTSTLEFIITNNVTTSPASDLAFTDVLPVGVVIATPASASSDCDGNLSALDGGGTISLSGGRLGASESCNITVNVTSSSVGTHSNNAGVVTSSVGSSFVASADLVVDAGRAGFTKSFSPSTITPGGTSTLTFIINNSANTAATLSPINFLDILPQGMGIASPANATTDCPFGNLTAELVDGGNGPGSFISLSSPFSLGAGQTCTSSVDVTTSGVGTFVNTTQDLLTGFFGSEVSSGFATAVLNVPRNTLAKSFTDDPVPPGGTATLEFTITNVDRSNPMTSIAFTDNLTTALSGLEMTAVNSNDCGGTVTGTSTIAFSGGSLTQGGTCTISVALDVPVGAASGAYTNTTNAISFDVGAGPVTGNTATDILVVEPAPTLAKEFTNDPVIPGSTVTLRFTITNTSTTSSATDITFTDVFPAELPTASTVPTSNFCNGTGTATFIPLIHNGTQNIPARLVVSGATLAANTSCNFDVILDVSEDAATGTFDNTTSNIFATVGGGTLEGLSASDGLKVVSAPPLSKTFTNDPVAPGGTVTLEFRLEHSGDAPGDATNISFTDDLNAVLPGTPDLSVSGSLPTLPCGSGSSLSDASGILTLAGGTLTPGSDCSFSVTLNVPAGAGFGTHTNTTSNVTADVAGTPTTGDPASDDLQVVALTLTKAFIDDPVDPGGTVTLQFTLTNDTGAPTATDIFFNDDFGDVLSGLTLITPLSTGTCNGAVLASGGNTVLTYIGGSLTGGSTCAFTVTLNVPGGAAPGTYGNVTSNLIAKFGGPNVVLPGAADALVVATPASIALSKTFDDENVTPIAPGDNVTLDFIIGYDGASNATAIGFTDNLGATLSGLEMTAINSNDCGGSVTGTSTIVFSGGSLTPGATCSISVTLLVPLTTPDTTVTNTTSSIAATVGGQPVNGDPAIDDLTIITTGSSEGDNAGRGNEPPIADAGPDTTVECSTSGGTSVALDGSGSSDPDNDVLTFSWTAPGITFDDATSATPTGVFPLGSTTVTLTVDDGDSTDTDEVVVTVEDTTPPVITLNGDNPLTLIRFSGPYTEPGAVVTDLCDPTPTLTITGGAAVNTNLPGTYNVTYDAADASSNDAVQKVRIVTVIDDPDAVKNNFLFLADKKIQVDKTAQSEGDMYSNDEIDLKKGQALFVGNVTAVGKIDIAKNITIDGDVTAGDELQLDNNVTITGTSSEFADVLPEPLPQLSYSSGGNDVKVKKNKTKSLTPGSYGKIEVEKNATLQLSTGEYFFEELILKQNADLEINLSAGPVVVNVVKKVDMNKNVQMSLTPLGENDSRYVTINSLEDMQIDQGSVLMGSFNAPQGKVDLKKQVNLRGSICSEEIDVDKNVVALQHDAQSILPTSPGGQTVTAVTQIGEPDVPQGFILDQNYPNPFNPTTTIIFAVPELIDVTLAIYNLRGQLIQTLHSGQISAGYHSVVWNGNDQHGNSMPSGIYFYQLTAGNFIQVRKMSLLK